MTARTMMSPAAIELCDVAGCRGFAAYRICVLLRAPSDANHEGEPIVCASSLVVCEAHRAAPPTTASDFVTDFERQAITANLATIGQPPPDFAGAVYRFDPLPPMSREAAH